MKKIILGAVVILAFGIIGCGGGNGSDPKGVLMSFTEALAKKDIEGAKKYATKDSEAMLGYMQMAISMGGQDIKDSTYDKDNTEYGEVKIEGDKATVPVKNKKSGETTIWALKKEDGKWKVAFDKATMTQMGTDKMKENGMDMNDMGNGMDSVSKMLQDMNKMSDSPRTDDDTSK